MTIAGAIGWLLLAGALIAASLEWRRRCAVPPPSADAPTTGGDDEWCSTVEGLEQALVVLCDRDFNVRGRGAHAAALFPRGAVRHLCDLAPAEVAPKLLHLCAALPAGGACEAVFSWEGADRRVRAAGRSDGSILLSIAEEG